MTLGFHLEDGVVCGDDHGDFALRGDWEREAELG